MDIRIPGYILAAGLLAFFNLRSAKSGEMMNRFSTLRRAEYPRFFAIFLIVRWVFVVICGLLALALSIGVLQ